MPRRNRRTAYGHAYRIERERLQLLVTADVKSAARLFDDDFELINPRGRAWSKAEYLRLVGSGQIDYEAWDVPDITVRLYGSVAVLRYQTTLHMKAAAVADIPPGRLWFTNLYEKRNGQWQVVWSQGTEAN